MIETIDKIDEKQWEDLVNQSDFASFFQTKECFDFFSTLSFLSSFVYGVVEDNRLKGVISGYIVLAKNPLSRFFSKRAIIQGGPLISNDISDEALAALLNHLKINLRKKAIYIEIRNSFDYSRFKAIFEKNGFDYCPHFNFQVDTKSGINAVFQNLSKSKRRQIRHSQKAGIEIIDTKDQQDIDQFYDILFNLYRHKVKKPLFPKEFIEKLITLPQGHLFVAKYEQQVISGMACVCWNKQTVYEWLVGGNDEKFKSVYPSVAITFGAIEFAANNGYQLFDFMGAGNPDEAYGVREFKAKFGGRLVEYGRFMCVNNKYLYQFGKFVIRLIKII